MGAVNEYYSALGRLLKNNPERVNKGTAINKDTVALEAGRKRGSIRNRPEFAQLIHDIESESAKKNQSRKGVSNRFQRNAENLKGKLDAAVNDKDIAQSRYMSLLYQNYLLKKQLQDNEVEPKAFGEVFDFDINVE